MKRKFQSHDFEIKERDDKFQISKEEDGKISFSDVIKSDIATEKSLVRIYI